MQTSIVYGEFWDNNITWNRKLGLINDESCYYNGELISKGDEVQYGQANERDVGNEIKLYYTIHDQ